MTPAPSTLRPGTTTSCIFQRSTSQQSSQTVTSVLIGYRLRLGDAWFYRVLRDAGGLSMRVVRRHRVIQCCFPADGIACLVVELSGRSVDMNVSVRLSVLVCLDGPGFRLPAELSGLSGAESFVKRSIVPLMLGPRVNPFHRLPNLG